MKVSDAANCPVNNECVFLVQAYSSVSDFKFTDDEKSSAYVKFMSADSNAEVLIDNIRSRFGH